MEIEHSRVPARSRRSENTIICIDSNGIVTAVFAEFGAARVGGETRRRSDLARREPRSAAPRLERWLALAHAASRGELDAGDLYDDVITL